LRVALITGEYPPRPGGVSDYSENLAAALADSGHKVDIVTCLKPSQSQTKPVAGVTVAIVPGWRLAQLPGLSRLIHETHPDLLVFQYVPQLYGRGGISPLAALVPLIARLAGARRVVTTLHELHSPWGDSPTSVLASAVQRLQLILIAGASNGLIVTNPLYLEAVDHRRLRASRLAEIPVGPAVPVARLSTAERQRVRRTLAGDAQSVVGEVSVGNVYKRPQDLVTVVEAIGGEGRLVCLGGLAPDQPRTRSLHQMLDSRGLAHQVTWTGFLSAEELSRSLSALDVYVHTGERGASTRSTALVSAMAHGLPIAAYRGPETPSFLQDGESVLLAESMDGHSLAAGVVRLLQDADLRRRMGAGARRAYERHMTWGQIAERVLAA
jgi:glycosyltransferase involved in cell wall biosynthesis